MDHCIHYDISGDLIKQALQDEKDLQRQKGAINPTTLPLNQRRDFIGSIAHNGVFEKIEEWGIYIEKTPYYKASIHKDEFDFYYNRSKIDIQGTLIKPNKQGYKVVTKWTSFLIKNEKEEKEMDQYCFTAIDLEEKVLHIVGIIDYEDVWTSENIAKYVPHPAHQVLAKDLKDLKKFIFRI